MKFLYYLIEIPLTVAAVWLVANTSIEGDVFNFEVWPLESEIQINGRLALCLLILYGFIWAKINSWFAYAPIRKALRSQKKANIALNKEQEKLNETVSGLQKNIVGLQEKAKQQEAEYAKNNPKPSMKQRLSAFFAGLFGRKKEN
ncbi:MAG: hypothetical protein IKO06_05510 [Alphaproteobacteria bacterium]|nr:hypothetical protein [Alphaproteobacteria bacterium]